MLLLFPLSPRAESDGEITFTCPIDGKKHTINTVVSGYQAGTFLDMKPYGAISAPWPINRCPDDGFPVYKERFSEDEIGKLKIFVKTKEYNELISKETSYYTVAQIQRLLEAPHKDISYSLLKSTWQVEKKPILYKKYAQEAINQFNSFINSCDAKCSRKDIVQAHIIVGELYRRLRSFDLAKERFLFVEKFPEIKGNVFENIVQQELDLISINNSEPQRVKKNRVAK